MRAEYGTEGPWHVGEVREVTGPLVMCEHGYHASVRAIDALSYAAGPVICRDELSVEILHAADKMVGHRRRLLWTLGAERSERLLHEFACDVAEDGLRCERKSGREPDARSWEAIESKRGWLRGEVSNTELAAARAAAEANARADQNRRLERMIVAAHRELAAAAKGG
jgi:hypothetical protein